MDVSGLAGIIGIVDTWTLLGVVGSICIGDVIGTCGVLRIFHATKMMMASPVLSVLRASLDA